MPQVNQAIGNTYETITRPVAIGVARDCLKQMGFDENAYLSFTGFGDVALNKMNSFEEIKKNFFGSDTTAEIEIKESPRAGMLYTMSVFRPDELCVFKDPASNLYIRPVYQPSEIELTFKLRFRGKGNAMKWRDDVYTRGNLMRHKNYHRIVYSYPLPEVYMTFLSDMHTIIKEHDSEEPQRFADWFFKYADKRTTTLTNGAGNEHMVVIPETQVRVLGWFNFEEIVDKPTYDKDTNTWTVEWSYTFLYDKAIECVLSHEMVVRQQLIQSHWLQETRPYDLDLEQDLALSNQNAISDALQPDFETRSDKYVNRTPMSDTWWPLEALQLNLKFYNPAYVALTSLLPDDSRLVLDLNELGEFKLNKSIEAYIASEHLYVTTPRESILNVSIFSDDDMALPRQQTLDLLLNLRATGDLNRRPVYRVVISVLTDLSKLSPEAQERSKNNACLLFDVFTGLWVKAAEMGLIPSPSSRCQWTDEQWDYIVDLLSPPKPNKPWPWGWPPIKVPGLDNLNPGYKPGGVKPYPDDMNIMTAIRTVGIYNVVARKPSNANR